MFEFMTCVSQKGMISTRKFPCRCEVCRSREDAANLSVVCPHLPLTGGINGHKVKLIRTLDAVKNAERIEAGRKRRESLLKEKIDNVKNADILYIRNPSLSPNPQLASVIAAFPESEQVERYHSAFVTHPEQLGHAAESAESPQDDVFEGIEGLAGVDYSAQDVDAVLEEEDEGEVVLEEEDEGEVVLEEEDEGES